MSKLWLIAHRFGDLRHSMGYCTEQDIWGHATHFIVFYLLSSFSGILLNYIAISLHFCNCIFYILMHSWRYLIVVAALHLFLCGSYFQLIHKLYLNNLVYLYDWILVQVQLYNCAYLNICVSFLIFFIYCILNIIYWIFVYTCNWILLC